MAFRVTKHFRVWHLTAVKWVEYCYYSAKDFKMEQLKLLREKVESLKAELELEKSKNASLKISRVKISQMSSEVVDSNPYR